MPRMKLDERDFNVKQLKNVDYQRSDIKRYDGEVPRTGTILICRVTRLWWTQSNDGTSAMKVLAVAEQNKGDRARYNGLPVWDFLTYKPEAAFRYMPFLLTFAIELDDIKRHMMIADEPDRFGDVIESIGDWEVGSDDAVCKIVIKNDPQYGAEPDRDGWLELEGSTTGSGPDDADDDEDDDDDEPPARPSRRAPARSSSRTASRSTSRSAGTRASRRQPEPEPEDEDEDYIDDEPEDEEDFDDEQEDDEDAEEAPPARSSRSGNGSRRAAPARSSTRSSAREPARSSTRTARTPARGASRDGGSRSRSEDGARASRAAARDRKRGGSDEEPPF
jgi:hypothetical protein